MVKTTVNIAAEIVRLLGGERGLARLRIHRITEHARGISAFVGRDPLYAVLVIIKTDGGFTLSLQSLLPPIGYSSYEVPGQHLKAALRMELQRRKGGGKM